MGFTHCHVIYMGLEACFFKSHRVLLQEKAKLDLNIHVIPSLKVKGH